LSAGGRKVRFAISHEFGPSYREFLAIDPRIKCQLTIFNKAKRTIPPTQLPPHFKDHALSGALRGIRECHLAHDILLLYVHENDVVHLLLVCNHAMMKGTKARATAKKVRKKVRNWQ
jgi:addiction module RelE/StbE family toxin